MSYREKRIKEFIISVSCIVMCLFTAVLTVLYTLTPKNEILQSTKEYYITSSFEYFEDNKNETTISLDNLIKKGYADFNDNLRYSTCTRKESYIIKNDNLYEIIFNCNNYKTNSKIYVNEEAL